MNDISTSLINVAQQAHCILKSNKLSLAVTESCTGGLIASAIVSIAGASEFFKGSAVCYCDVAKNKILNVKKETLDTFFAESPECAIEMASGAKNIYGSSLAISSTGFLDANTAPKPIELGGKVFICLCGDVRGRKIEISKIIALDVDNDRNQNRTLVAIEALKLLEEI